MILGIVYGLAVGMAWGISLAFTGMERNRIRVNGLVAALVCGILVFLLNRAGASEAELFAGALAVSLMMALSVYVQNGRAWENALISLALSVGAACVLLSAFGVPGEVGRVSLVFGLFVFLLFVTAVRRLEGSGLEAGWKEFYKKRRDETGRMKLKLSYFYLILVVICFLPAVGMWLSAGSSVGLQVIWSIAAAFFYWLGIFSVLLMNACTKERNTVLAEQQYRDEMESFMNVIRSQRHDYNFHVQTIAGLVHEGKIDECVRYVDALEQDAAAMNAVLPVKDAAIAAMIHNFQIQAAREGIRLQIDIQNDLSQIATNVYETNKIISNLLQNAIDETVTHTDKSYGIRLSILKRGEYCVIRVSNELKGGMEDPEHLGRIFQQGYSTKHGHDGVGLSSIRTLAARYRGMIYTEVEGNVIHFVAKIPINYAKTAED